MSKIETERKMAGWWLWAELRTCLLSDLSERRRFPVCHWSMCSKGRLKLPENDPFFLTTEKLLGKGIFLGKRDYFGALKIVPGYAKMDSEKQQKEDMTEDE